MGKFNFYFGTAAGSLLLAVMVVAGELFAPFKDFLKNTFSHHWIGKLVIIAVVFFVISFLLKDKTSIGKYSDENLAWYSVLLSIIAIFAFFIIHYLA